MDKENEVPQQINELSGENSFDIDSSDPMGDEFFSSENDDNDESDSDDEVWEDVDDSFLSQEKVEEAGQIENFLQNVLMVRCERYNANLTSVGCRRKKEASPPRVKNSSLSEEESMQNHPCFGCLGPIVVNWPVDQPPILMNEVDYAPVILHSTVEEGFSSNRNAKNEEERADAQKQTQEMSSAGALSQNPEYIPSVSFERLREMQSATLSKREQKRRSFLKSSPEEVELTSAKEIASSDSKKKKEIASSDSKKKKEIASSDSKKKKEIASSDSKKKKEVASEDVPLRSLLHREETLQQENLVSPEPGPCILCARPYTPKYWRGDICNPCYAKKLREKKKAKQFTDDEEKDIEDTHPPCSTCGREYTAKHWRGMICNPCYAKKLREKKKAKKTN